MKRALLVLACAILPLTASAARRVPVFLVDVAGQSAPALQQAMRAALVRATGRPQAANDPAFATLVAQAPKYVVNYQHGARGQLQVAFNGAAVDQVIASLGRSVWGAERPFTLIVLNPMPDQTDYQTDHDALEQAAEARGLPVSIMPLPVTGTAGHLLPEAGLLALVHRFGAEQLLIGQPPAGASIAPGAAPSAGAVPGSGVSIPSPQNLEAQPTGCTSPAAPKPGANALPGRSSQCGSPASASPQTAASASAGPTAGSSPAPAATGGASAAPPAAAQWHWILVTPFMRRSFSGSVTAGIDGTVNLLAPPPTAGRAAEVSVSIEGVSDLSDYAHIERMLAAVPGVSRADVSEVRTDTAVFSVQAQGGDATVAGMLADSRHFARIQDASGALVYRYLPGPKAASPASSPATSPPAGSPATSPPAGSPATSPPATRTPPPATR